MDDWDDDFGAGPSHAGGVADPLVDTEYARLQQRYTDAGYREGITDGKLSTLQAGFDASFAASVPPSRRLGQLRGRANALVAILSAPPARAASESPPEDALATARALLSELSSVRRDDVLPPDLERIAHEREEHADNPEYAFELAATESREMEGLEDALGRLGGGKEGKRELREERLLDALEERVRALEAMLGIEV